MFERTNSSTNVALITLCAFLPSLLLSPLGGVLADKFDRRLMMILEYSLSAIGLVYILVSMLTGEIAIWQIYFGVTISSVFSSLSLANTGADVLVRKNIPNEIQGRAWALIGLISQMGFVVAYALGGILADYIFNPLLMKGGALSSSVGKLIGVGEGRGIGLLFILAGIFVVILSVIIGISKSIFSLEKSTLRRN